MVYEIEGGNALFFFCVIYNIVSYISLSSFLCSHFRVQLKQNYIFSYCFFSETILLFFLGKRCLRKEKNVCVTECGTKKWGNWENKLKREKTSWSKKRRTEKRTFWFSFLMFTSNCIDWKLSFLNRSHVICTYSIRVFVFWHWLSFIIGILNEKSSFLRPFVLRIPCWLINVHCDYFILKRSFLSMYILFSY